MGTKRGFFIAFDGLDGCGKSTQAKLLASYLVENSYSKDVVLTFEPGGSPIGKIIRQITLYSDLPINMTTELLLMLAERSEHISTVISPSLVDGKIVICDRFSESTIVYQGVMGGIDLQLVAMLDNVARKSIWPDMYIYLDIPEEVAWQRALQRSNQTVAASKYDVTDISFFKGVRDAFINEWKNHHRPLLIVDGTGSIEEVHKRIVKKFLGKFYGTN
ncbi:MAG: dTMP kinase [Ardenticatenaceae bacterium]|nr:dTMP kinase [Ardenticatenaceae bacterium]